MYYYVLKDERTGYGDLLRFPSDEYARREFENELKNENSMICRYKKDYSMWRIRDFDTKEGVFTNTEKVLIARGENYITKEE